MSEPDQGKNRAQWEVMGAAAGLFAVLLYAVAFAIFLSTSPGGGNTPQLPDIANAQAAPAFFADHLTSIRAQVMLNSIATILFLWFVGALWARLHRAEGEPSRGSVTAVGGAFVGVALTLTGLVLTGTSALTTSLEQGQVVPTLYTAAALSFALGGAAFSVFFLAVAEVVLRRGAMATWLGIAALLAAALSAFGFLTPYYTEGLFNAATGGLGFYAHYIGFVVWLLLASVDLVLVQRRSSRIATQEPTAAVPATGNEGDNA